MIILRKEMPQKAAQVAFFFLFLSRFLVFRASYLIGRIANSCARMRRLRKPGSYLSNP